MIPVLANIVGPPRKQAQSTPPGIERARLIRRARQAETGARLGLSATDAYGQSLGR